MNELVSSSDSQQYELFDNGEIYRLRDLIQGEFDTLDLFWVLPLSECVHK